MPTALTTLMKSSKAWVLLLAIAAVTYALQRGLLTAEQYQELLLVWVPGWMGAHAYERSAKHKASAAAPEVVTLPAPAGPPDEKEAE